MSKKARFCQALLALLGMGGLTASKCDGPVEMYGPAPMYGVPTVMYGPAPMYTKAPMPSTEDVDDVQADETVQNSEENR